MIRRVSLKNFKSISNLEDLELKPLTILCGPNAVGKSSLIQSLLLLKQTLGGAPRGAAPRLNGPWVSLGRYGDLVYSHDETRDVGLSMEFELQKRRKRSFEMPFAYMAQAAMIEAGFVRAPASGYRLTVSWEFASPRDPDDEVILPQFDQAARLPRLKRLEYRLAWVDAQNTDSRFIAGFTPQGEGWNVAYETIGRYPDDERDSFIASVLWDRLGPRMLYLMEDAVLGEDADGSDDWLPFAWDFEISNYERRAMAVLLGRNVDDRDLEPEVAASLAQAASEGLASAGDEKTKRRLSYARALRAVAALANLTTSLATETVCYLAPDRIEPARDYPMGYDWDEVGPRGQNAVQVYIEEQARQCEDLRPPSCERAASQDVLTVSAVVESWFEHMGLGTLEVKESTSEPFARLELGDNRSGSSDVSIADTGFGVSQVLPIVVQGALMTAEDTLLLEQPEVHLHPRLQMDVADLLITLANADRCVVAETHSDHIVNRVVRRVVDGSLAPDRVALYFVSAGDDGPVFEPILIDESLGIVNWPDGFFDQGADEQEAIIRASMKRRSKRDSSGKAT